MNENSKLFDFEKEKVQTLSLDTLERTHKENDIYGNPLRGIYHYALLQQLIEMCQEHHYDVEVYDLFAAQNRDRNTPGVVLLPQVEAIYGERAVEAHILRRVFANIRLTNWDDESYTTNLAVAFHQKGIQVGFGNMVKICHNQCMLCPTQYVSTYNERGNGRSPQQVTIEEVMQTVKSWLFDAEHRIVTERAKIERMKQIEVNAQQMFTLIGMLTAIRVKCDSRNKSIHENRVYPLNQAQISDFTEQMLVRYDDKRIITAWDVYDAATNLYKANTMDIPSLMPQNRAMVRFLDEQFNLETLEA
ncbi:MAG: DUF932 domain-containing protein [Paludibacteraceae bacterium]|nr:DUF932 domain-containing protein [Paludibacteraceae bacterium]